MYEQKTKAGTGDVQTFIDALDGPIKRADSLKMIEIMRTASGEEPVLWGTMIGFGRYHYTYGSGHAGDSFLVGFAPRKTEFSLYLVGCALPGHQAERDGLLARFGKYRMGKACIYIKRLSDIDMDVLRELTDLSVRAVRLAYP